MTIIAPSVLSLDYSKVNEQMNELNKSKAKWIHFDVMDGHFVPNLSFGPDILKGLKKLSKKTFDVHIMVSDPLYYAQVFATAGADIVTFHLEACNLQTLIKTCSLLHSKNIKSGISIKPGTDVRILDPVLKYFDVVLIMSVEPGFGGQKFDDTAIEKIKYLRKKIDEENLEILIEVDGGINAETGRRCKEAGCDVLVAGSYVFKGDICERVESLL